MGKLNNILKGMALLNIFPAQYNSQFPKELRLYTRNDLSEQEKDAYALASDWKAVGDDIRNAMEKL